MGWQHDLAVNYGELLNFDKEWVKLAVRPVSMTKVCGSTVISLLSTHQMVAHCNNGKYSSTTIEIDISLKKKSSSP